MAERDNPPRQSSLRYRAGTQPELLARMLHRISRQLVPPDDTTPGRPRPLAALSTRDPSDASIAMMDAWACALDVVTFYQERILNEAYIRTATERLSLVEIARAIGYVPRPGVAANVKLTFFVDEAESSPEVVEVPKGLAVLAKPEPKPPAALPPAPALSQPSGPPPTYETIEALDAHRVYNELYPVQGRRQTFDVTTDHVYVDPNARLGVGDPVLLMGPAVRGQIDLDVLSGAGTAQIGERWDLRFVGSTEMIMGPDGTPASMRVNLDRPLGDPATNPSSNPFVFTFRERASIFGHAAPPLRAMPDNLRDRYGVTGATTRRDWPSFDLASDDDAERGRLHLDREYPRIVADSYLVLQARHDVEVYRAKAVHPAERDDFGLTAKCTAIDLAPLRPSGDPPEHLLRFPRRSTVVHGVSEPIERRTAPLTTAVEGTEIELSTAVPEMAVGRRVIVTGEAVTGGQATTATRIAGFRNVSDAEGTRSVLVLDDILQPLKRETVRIFGNVAAATHGTTVPNEVLGSGRNDLPGQRFPLKHAPLTWLSAPTPSGAEAALEIRVNDGLWSRVDTLFGQPADARVYSLGTEESGTTYVQFGDGVYGARLPTGTENVVAIYRRDLGIAGEVGEGRLTILQQRPVGLRAVDNFERASGGGDPEGIETIRSAAPLGVITLDRLVSLDDYEIFARAFAGVGKARADALWDGRRDLVHVTVGSASGLVLETDDELFRDLTEAIHAFRDPRHHVIVSPHREVRFAPHVDVLRAEAYRAEDVEAAAYAALQSAFAYSVRSFGQPVTEAEVVEVLHGIEGIIAVNVTAFSRENAAGDRVTVGQDVLPAASATLLGGAVSRAELLVLDTEWIQLGWMADA